MTDWTSKENVSTLATWIGIAILPFAIELGIDLDQATITAIVATIIVLAIAIYSSLNPNKIDSLGNTDKNTIDTNEQVLNDEYETIGDDGDGGC